MILQLGAITNLSPFAKVRVLLSSRTEFKFSIQILSTGPSKTNHICSAKICRNYMLKSSKFSIYKILEIWNA